MLLTKFISKSCIVPELRTTAKGDVIKELTHLLFEKKGMDGVGAAIDQIIAREGTESTGIGHGIAVPHARVAGMKTLACAIGRVKNGMDFLAVDRKPVHLIFLICYPPNEQTTYLNFIATVARLLSKPDRLREVLEAPAADDIYAILEEASSSFERIGEQAAENIEADPEIERMPDAHADLIILARLQLCQEMLAVAKTGKTQIKQRIENLRALVEPRILKHYDRLMKSHAPALVPVEGDTCQGCFIRLPSKFVQRVRLDSNHIHTCPNCRRYIYVV